MVWGAYNPCGFTCALVGDAQVELVSRKHLLLRAWDRVDRSELLGVSRFPVATRSTLQCHRLLDSLPCRLVAQPCGSFVMVFCLTARIVTSDPPRSGMFV